MLADETHAVHLTAIAVSLTINVGGLAWLNRLKGSGGGGQRWPWERKRLVYWAYITFILLLGCYTDRSYPIQEQLLGVKTYTFCFSLGLIDFYFSETTHVPMQVVLGASLWYSTLFLRQSWVRATLGKDLTHVVSEFGATSLLAELLRFVVSILGVGLTSDLMFSPMHRLMHHSKIYALNHKTHHSYTNKLTSLVLYHGELLDDFLMPITTTLGGYIYHWILMQCGFADQAFSNVVGYLIIFNNILSHAHDVRCASLIVPLPDSLNFAAYHRVHHLNPNANYGLTRPSDMFWDAVLGQDTIMDFAKIAEYDESKPKES
eukprot:TRINITY_DN114644_c0_g1_i1.p1 TRINITY_DN114644_c0_g1~~TRINITY_DN114644_c0_g1_i1.p1  ORF type:complete len:318 (+),score=36.97 TRINITY_DN114644_c0_g1_i1:77-1030(+)